VVVAENRELALVLKLVADEFQRELKKSQGQLSVFNDFIKDWKTQLAAAGTVLVAVTKSTADYGDQLVKMGQRLGTTIQETSRLQHAARLADTDLHGLSSTVAFLSKRMLEAASGNSDAVKAFSDLGLSVTTTSGNLKRTTDILLELSDRVRSMPDGPEKLARMMEVLGKSAKDNLPLLNSNLREAFKETKELGLEMSTKAAKAAEEFNDQITKLQGAVKGASNTVGETLMPSMTALSKILTTIIADANSAVRALSGLDKFEAPQVGVVQPEGGGRRLRVVPSPSEEEAKQFATKPFFRTPEQAAAEEEQAAKKREKEAKEQIKLGQQKLAIHLSQNEALEIQFRLQQGPQLDEHVKEMERAEDAAIEWAKGLKIVKETQEQLAALEQQRLGRQIVQNTQADLAIQEQLRRESLTFFDGWKEGMAKYVQDTQTGFGFAADMARRTAQAMEQNFRQFFFDLMEGRIRTIEDMLKGVLSFITQIASQVASQLATKAVLGSFFGANTGGLVQHFATGGPVLGSGNRDTVPALLTPGEWVLSRNDVGDIKRGLGSPVRVVVNNYSSNEVNTTSRRGPDGVQELEIMVAKTVSRSISDGRMDKVLRSRYGLSPGGG
jgi:hypothetical protein